MALLKASGIVLPLDTQAVPCLPSYPRITLHCPSFRDTRETHSFFSIRKISKSAICFASAFTCYKYREESLLFCCSHALDFFRFQSLDSTDFQSVNRLFPEHLLMLLQLDSTCDDYLCESNSRRTYGYSLVFDDTHLMFVPLMLAKLPATIET